MAPAVPLTITPKTQRGHPLPHLVNTSPPPIQLPTVESYDLGRFIEVAPPIEPAVLPSVETGVIPHWIFTPGPAKSEGNKLRAGTHSDHVPASAVVAVILTMVAMGGLLALVVAGQLLRWSRRAKLARVKESGRRRASTNTPQTGRGPALDERERRRLLVDGVSLSRFSARTRESFPRVAGGTQSNRTPRGRQRTRIPRKSSTRYAARRTTLMGIPEESEENNQSQTGVPMTLPLPGEKQAGTSTEDQECTIGKDDPLPSRHCDTYEESETSVSDVVLKPDDRNCTIVDSSPRIETAAEKKDSAEKICQVQRAEIRSVQGVDAKGMERHQVPGSDSSTAGKVDEGDSTRPESQLALESPVPS